MSCPAPEQLAAAATEGDDAILAHAETCTSCLHALDDQRALRALGQRAPAVVLTHERREAMAAELMAQAERLPPPSIARPAASRRRTAALLVAGLAAAAAIVIVVATRRGSRPERTDERLAAPASARTDRSARPATDTPRTIEPIIESQPIDPRTDPRASDGRPAARTPDARAAAKLAGSGDYARDARDAKAPHDIVRLRGGELTVDSTGSGPVEVVSGGTAIAVKKARVKVIASHGVVSSVAVFAGSAEVTVDGHRVIVEAGTVWERDVARDEALAAFRTGWTALRSGDNTAAIAAFDRATDPTVAEDATYWGAIASERVGDTDGALRRYRDLLARFPSTTRASEARAALARLAP